LIENGHCFPSQLKLNKPEEYQKVFANPFKTTDKFFTVLAIQNKYSHARLGLAIAKKNIKRAVDRNKIKRSTRENFRTKQHQLGNWDIVVLARRDAANAPKNILTRSLNEHWLKLAQRCDSYSCQ
jgi:ribonuclease P protein component